MDLIDKLETAATTNGPLTLTAPEARELYARLVDTETELHESRLTLDHVVDVFAPGKRSTVRN